jgi:hypothetical protein
MIEAVRSRLRLKNHVDTIRYVERAVAVLCGLACGKGLSEEEARGEEQRTSGEGKASLGVRRQRNWQSACRSSFIADHVCYTTCCMAMCV